MTTNESETMPVFPIATLDRFDHYDRQILEASFTTREQPAGMMRLRSTKPYKRSVEDWQSKANYVWRMLCFDCVSYGKHACMPVTAEFDVSDAYEYCNGKRPLTHQEGYVAWKAGFKALKTELDDLTMRFEKNLPVGSMKGVMRWGKALGLSR